MFGITKAVDEKNDMEFFVIYDSKSKSYDKPLHSTNRHTITREIVNMFRSPESKNNALLTNAEDFSLFKIGSFTKHNGEIQAHKPEHIANLHELRTIALEALTSNPGIVAT